MIYVQFSGVELILMDNSACCTQVRELKMWKKSARWEVDGPIRHFPSWFGEVVGGPQAVNGGPSPWLICPSPADI